MAVDKEMKSYKQYITEVFDKPLKWNEFLNRRMGTRGAIRKSEFRIGDLGYVITLRFAKTSKYGKAMSVEFGIGDEGGVRKGHGSKHDISGTGNAGQIIATVLDYTKNVMKKEKPNTIIFTAKEPSRKKLYKAIANRFKRDGVVGNITVDGTKFYLEVK